MKKRLLNASKKSKSGFRAPFKLKAGWLDLPGRRESFSAPESQCGSFFDLFWEFRRKVDFFQRDSGLQKADFVVGNPQMKIKSSLDRRGGPS